MMTPDELDLILKCLTARVFVLEELVLEQLVVNQERLERMFTNEFNRIQKDVTDDR
jgi:hypothetical protein